MHQLRDVTIAGTWVRLAALAFLLTAPSLGPAGATDLGSDPLVDGREQFLAAYAAADSGAQGTATRDSDVLRATRSTRTSLRPGCRGNSTTRPRPRPSAPFSTPMATSLPRSRCAADG